MKKKLILQLEKNLICNLKEKKLNSKLHEKEPHIATEWKRNSKCNWIKKKLNLQLNKKCQLAIWRKETHFANETETEFVIGKKETQFSIECKRNSIFNYIKITQFEIKWKRNSICNFMKKRSICN